MLRLMKLITGIILAATLLFVVYLLYMTATDYSPSEKTPVDITNNQVKKLTAGVEYSLMTYNIGYCGLDDKQDFFMDGGKGSRAESRSQVLENLSGVKGMITKFNPDFLLLQEVDKKALRSFNVNEYYDLINSFSQYGSTFAENYKVSWVPVPLYKPMGYVDSGIMVMSRFNMAGSTRYQYPGRDIYPKYLADLDRCFDEAVIPVNNGKKLILVNSHLSAYDSGGTIRKQELDYLSKYMSLQKSLGNYVIVGGDFNHVLPGTAADTFTHQEPWPNWLHKLPEDFKPQGYSWVFDDKTPSVRTIAGAYVPGYNFLAVIDGFIVSDNVKVKEVKGINTDFKYSDHNPVTFKFQLE